MKYDSDSGFLGGGAVALRAPNSGIKPLRVAALAQRLISC